MKKISRPILFGMAATTVMMAACGGDDSPLPVPEAAALRQACPALSGTTVAASDIGIASGAASVTSAKIVAAATNGSLPEYCELQGSIAPLGAGADPIRFQLNLPLAWNEKAVMHGGGGFNGSLITGLSALRDAPAGLPLPVARGYATYGTDSGHDGTAYNATDPAKFALNEEMVRNFAHESYKKVKDSATVLMRRFYLRNPSKQFFFGGSEGGREGLVLAQRYPADFDGIVSVVPVVHWNGLFTSFLNFTKPQFTGGTLSTAKIRLIATAVNQACDALDGLADGVVNNYLGCTSSRVNLQALRCAGGTDTGDTCLSDAQLATVNAVYQPTVLPFPLANGLTTYPGRLYGGEVQPGEGFARWVSTGLVPTTPPIATDARGVIFGSSYARNLIARNPAFDIRNYDPAAFAARIREVSELMDATNPDLSAFHARGGKLIIRENSGDFAQSPMAGIQYYGQVVARMTQPTTDQFLRLYVSPASSHGGGAASFTTGTEVATSYDLLGTIDQWVSSGQAPADALTQVRNATTAPFSTLASRPMCRYPNYPRYVAGDALKAESYQCTVSAP